MIFTIKNEQGNPVHINMTNFNVSFEEGEQASIYLNGNNDYPTVVPISEWEKIKHHPTMKGRFIDLINE